MFVIKNLSNRDGEVKIEGDWRVIKPGESITSSIKPSVVSNNVLFYKSRNAPSVIDEVCSKDDVHVNEGASFDLSSSSSDGALIQ